MDISISSTSYLRRHLYRIIGLPGVLILSSLLYAAIGQVTDSIANDAFMKFVPEKKEIRIVFELPALKQGEYKFDIQIINRNNRRMEKLVGLTTDCKQINDVLLYTLSWQQAKSGSSINLDKFDDYKLVVRYRVVEGGGQKAVLPGNASGHPLRPYLISTILPAGPAYLEKPGPQWSWIPTIGGYASLVYSIDKAIKLNQPGFIIPNSTKLIIGSSLTGILWIAGYVVTGIYVKRDKENNHKVSMLIHYDCISHVPLFGLNIALTYEK